MADASSGSSSSATNATGSSGNATVTSKYFIDVDDVLDYSCSQVRCSAFDEEEPLLETVCNGSCLM